MQVAGVLVAVSDFSIVIPFRHGAKYAWSSLMSCRLAAKNFNIQVVICLDNPGEHESALLKLQIKRVGLDVNLIDNNGFGISAALNTAIQSTEAKFIVRHDIDDIMMPSRIRYCSELFDQGADYIFGSALRFPKIKRITVPLNLEAARRRALHECPFIHPGSAFKKSAWDHIGRYNSYFDGVEDFDLWSRVLWSEHSIKCDERLHVLYRRHPAQFTRTRDGHQTNLKRIEIFERNRLATLSDLR